ncbi:MAG: guanylate kinase [Calditrichaeota bacterium]|nr:MAG: guanylate kinase [Calditrichota bacterium]MBL1204144.1 guanylate kinase [Calditrichota bacterium]NOG43975.1 guanylate kinase [Calditrichota bacterium]
MKFKSQHIVFSAPSGAGKTTIVKILLEKHPNLAISVSATTRAKRPFEKDGKDYYFLSPLQFKRAAKENKFLEYEEVHGNIYGTLKDKVDESVAAGKTVLFDIDVKGAKSIQQAYKDALLIFIKPPGKDVLRQRLIDRKSEDTETINKRLERLDFEYEQASFFNHVVVNDDLNTAVKEVEKLIIDDTE